MQNEILTVHSKQEESFLRRKTKHFRFSEKGEPIIDEKTFPKREVVSLVARMKKIMRNSNGIGLSANQIGLPYAMCIALIPTSQGTSKLYIILNPEIEKRGKESTLLEEGCLSVPGKYGEVRRDTSIVIQGFDKNGKPLRIKAWGLLAHVFQHEIDHLNGILFTDKAKIVYDAPRPGGRLEKKEYSAT